MIGYVTLGTNGLPRAVAFYDKLLASIGIARVYEMDRGMAWGKDMASPSLAVMKPFDGQAASVGNGTMVALGVGSKAQVDGLHQLALSLGSQDEGAPGLRGDHFYGAYFRDLDGNKLACFCMV